MNEQDAAKVLMYLKGIYQHRMEVNTMTPAAWARALRDVSFEDAMKAADVWIDAEAWPPATSDIKDRVAMSLPGFPSVDDAWNIVRQRIASTYPGIEAPKWTVPDIVQLATKDVGGLRSIRLSEKPAETEKRFRLAYTERLRGEASKLALSSTVRELPE